MFNVKVLAIPSLKTDIFATTFEVRDESSMSVLYRIDDELDQNFYIYPTNMVLPSGPCCV